MEKSDESLPLVYKLDDGSLFFIGNGKGLRSFNGGTIAGRQIFIRWASYDITAIIK